MTRPLATVVLLLSLTAFARDPSKAALEAATRYGKYADLQKVLEVPEDMKTYGEVHDWGWWDGTEWAGHQVPPGYWVYVYPHWFVFKTQLKKTPPADRRPW